jgi:DNA replication and repair protein RecF
MILTRISLSTFRSYAKKSFDIHPYVTLIVGANAAGKTNIIEAISMTSTGKSFRADSDREVIRWGEELARVVSRGSEETLEIVITTGEVSGRKAPSKKFLVNGVPRRGIDFVGNLHSVLFWPEDLELVTDSPSLRRRYLDRVLVQVDREYRRNLSSYERGLRQRNSLLDRIQEGTAARSQLLFWNQLLIRAGTYITESREAFLAYVNACSLEGCSYRIDYDRSVISEARLLQYAEEEVAAGATLVGPHRDDIEFKIKNTTKLQLEEYADTFIPLSAYGSRGEQRLGVLWLKLAELSFITEKTGNRPILLLDDIFSELDEKHKKLILDVIRKQQTVITSAEYDVEGLLKKEKIEYTKIELTHV